ncbi:MAG: hypothetical protein GX825_05525 [Syntrophomonadaceae bacterium]|nr:hypothetical protein [Syntrophomonadaceae bacterium]
MRKKSIRFFDDTEVRAIWDEDNSTWRYSVLDIVCVLHGEKDYQKIRNYWKYLKSKLSREKRELVNATTELKIAATEPDDAAHIRPWRAYGKKNKGRPFQTTKSSQ